MPRVLELFSGTGSIGRAFEKLGWTITSLDKNPKFDATHIADILEWDHTMYPSTHFDFVWCSPCCTQYSIARTCGPPRELLSADRLVGRALDIITYFFCNWAMENPQSGLLKTRDIVKGLQFFDTSYCRYGYSYRKATRVWSNLILCLRKPCSHKDPCTAMVGRRHPKTPQQSRRSSDPSDRDNNCSTKQLYSIPPELCDEIADAAESNLRGNNAHQSAEAALNTKCKTARL